MVGFEHDSGQVMVYCTDRQTDRVRKLQCCQIYLNMTCML